MKKAYDRSVYRTKIDCCIPSTFLMASNIIFYFTEVTSFFFIELGLDQNTIL